jgi:hypothetical protein
MDEEVVTYRMGEGSTYLDSQEPARKRYKKDAYFSDEEEFGGDD